MTNTEITEAYFKVLGWIPGEHRIYGKGWKIPSNAPEGTTLFRSIIELPKILTDYPAFKEHVLEVIGEEGFKPHINADTVDKTSQFIWKQCSRQGYIEHFFEPIKDNNILHAAVEAATRYFGRKK